MFLQTEQNDFYIVGASAAVLYFNQLAVDHGQRHMIVFRPISKAACS